MSLGHETSRSESPSAAIPIHGVTAATLPARAEALGALAAGYAKACGFRAQVGQTLLVPGSDGALACVLFGVEAPEASAPDLFLAGKLVGALPPGTYRLADGFQDPSLAVLGFRLGSYRFERFRKTDGTPPQERARLLTPPGVDGDRLDLVVGAVALGRDLINRPANDLTPNALEAAARELAEAHGARADVTIGEALASNFPMVHAVGRAAAEAPRLFDMVWGDESAPKVTLVGKGVCFDTGGLDIKPSAAMLLMKKDMGGAATAMALAHMIMGAALPVRLRLLLPIVENAIAGDAFRPGDILRSRKGLTVEVGNTDAEGRLILADALALADEETPELLFDFATLTGAARVALGPDLPPFYTSDDHLASAIAAHATAANDPGWRMPLWDPYDTLLKSKVADLNNISSGPFAGSITAALFLRRFVERTRSWAHFDVYGWTPSAKPGHPEGGAVQMARGLFDLLAARYARAS
jgi:leucyl aminopeptidase